MIVYRLNKARYSTIDGKGAADYPGRWNERGIPAVYASASPSLALLEILVNFEDWTILAAASYILMKIEIPEQKIRHLQAVDLPPGWNSGALKEETRRLGSIIFADPKLAGFSVPSAVINTERNYILNPLFETFDREIKIVEVSPFVIDERLLSKRSKL